MSPGSYISFALHLGFVGWLVLNGDFSRKPSEMAVADVSVVSSEVFDVMINNISPEILPQKSQALRRSRLRRPPKGQARQKWMPPPRNWRKA